MRQFSIIPSILFFETQKRRAVNIGKGSTLYGDAIAVLFDKLGLSLKF